jgi:3-phenylpropionate/trans-cinnamate dioxygenase ferredoxin subunit
MAEFVKVATVADLPAGTARQVNVGGRKIALVNTGGVIYAVDDTCTHEEASLSAGPVMGDLLVCPKHGSRFHLPTGRVLSLPAVKPVRTYPVRVDGDDVLLSLEARPGQGMPHRP